MRIQVVHKSGERCVTLWKITSEDWTLYRKVAKRKATSREILKELQYPTVPFVISVAPLQCISNNLSCASTTIRKLIFQEGLLGMTTTAKVFLTSASYCVPTSVPTLPAQSRGWRGVQLNISNTLVLRSSWRKWVPSMVVNCPTRWSLLFVFGFLCWSSVLTPK